MSLVKTVKFVLMGLRHALHVLIGEASSCRFVPTCSAYGTQAIEKHGFFRGLGLLIKRLLKCHPWGKAGLDLVPENLKSLEGGNGC